MTRPLVFEGRAPTLCNGRAAGQWYVGNNYIVVPQSAPSGDLSTRNKAQIPLHGSQDDARVPSNASVFTESSRTPKRKRALSPDSRENAHRVRLRWLSWSPNVVSTSFRSLCDLECVSIAQRTLAVEDSLLLGSVLTPGTLFRSFGGGSFKPFARAQTMVEPRVRSLT